MEINKEYLEKELASKKQMKEQSELIIYQLVGQIKLLEYLIGQVKTEKNG